MARYPAKTVSFIPEATGQVINVITLTPEEMEKKGLPRYYQQVVPPPPEEEDHADPRPESR